MHSDVQRQSVLASFQQSDFLASVNIKDAYLQFQIFSLHHRFLRFEGEGCHFQFVAKPFDLSKELKAFAKVLALVLGFLLTKGNRVIEYLDNLLVKEQWASLLEISVSPTLERF